MKWLLGWIAIAIALSGCDCGDRESVSVATWLDLEIERPEIEIVEPDPPAPIVEEEDGEDLITRAYLVPPSFLVQWGGGDAGAAPDPFAAPPERVQVKELTAAREILESYGMVFGPGTWAIYRKADSNLIVRQTRDQMDLVEAITQGLGGPHEIRAINVRVEIYEVSTGDARELEKSASEHFENTPELNAVIDLVSEGNARIVTVMGLKCRSGQRAASDAGIDYRYLAEFDWKGEGENRILKPVFRSRMVGTLLEVDGIIGATDLVDIRLTLEHHTAPPKLERREMAIPGGGPEALPVELPVFFFHKIDTYETMLSGSVKLLGSWSPAGAESGAFEVRQIAFLRTDLQPVMGADVAVKNR